MRDKLIELLANAFDEGTVKCLDCFDDDVCLAKGYCDDWVADVSDNLIAHGVMLATDNNDGDKWIPVSEKYPEYGQDVLMYFDTGNMAVGFSTDGEYWSAYSDDGWFTDCDGFPLFWMPLPVAPKEGE